MGIEFPEELSGGGVERKNFLRGRDSVEDATHDDGAGLQSALLAGVKSPGDVELLHVCPVDLCQRRIVGVLGSAAVDGAIQLRVYILLLRADARNGNCQSRANYLAR